MHKQKVVLVAGAAHGGTTITSIILGQHPEIFVTGKLRGFPRGDFFDPDNICSCGAAGGACPFWNRVRARYGDFEGMSERDQLSGLYAVISELSESQFVGDVTHNFRDVNAL